MGTPEKNAPSLIPKISKNLTYRTLFLFVVFGSLAGGLYWFLKVRSDLGGLHTSNTVGWISAVEFSPQSQQAVLISPDGKVHKDLGHVAGGADRDLAWSPKGNFLYFVSDREDHNFNLFRWAPDLEKAERRTIGTRARSDLRFPAQPTEDSDSTAKALIITGGLVQEFDPTNQSTSQVLPPTSKEITQSTKGEEQGTEGQFEGVYGTLGTSFRDAQWCSDHHGIAAIMRRESGEVLIYQDMRIQPDGKLLQPSAMIAGDHIDLAVNPKDGTIVFCVTGFQFTDPNAALDKDGKKRAKPFINGVGFSDFKKSMILAANQGQVTFTSPAISPDGTGLAIVLGKKDETGDVSPMALATLSAKGDSSYKGTQFSGSVHEPSWAPDGAHILVAVTTPAKHRSIFEIPTDGSPPRNVTGDVGDYGFPHYSPQVKTN